MAAVTEDEITVDVGSSSGNISMLVRVELRHNSPRWWTRATPFCSASTCGGGASTVGVAKIQVRQRPVGGSWGSWSTKESKTVTADPGDSQWTDDSYNPPNSNSSYDRQIRSAFTDNNGKTWATGSKNL